MNTVTIPKNITRGEELIVIPRKEYEALHLRIIELPKNVKTYTPTPAEKKAIAQARKRFEKGDYIEWHQLKNELADLRNK